LNPPTTPNPGAPSPIADRSYRNYDGPIRTRALRWWIVALSIIRVILHKPAFWVLSGIAVIPYLVAGVMLYTNSLMSMGGPIQGHPFAPQFYSALERQQFWIFLTALVVGTDCIAGDLRANALLIYLSKPIAKGDYLLGKWMGVFLPLYLLSIAPAILLFLLSAFGLFGDGFLKTEPTLAWRMIIATSIPALVNASLLLGFSAWSKSGRIAGAAYAGVYLITALIANIIGGLQMRSHHVSAVLVQHLSVSGAVTGLAEAVYGVKAQTFRFFAPQPLPHGFLWEMLGLCATLSLLGIAMARVRINAVEVVRG
jgi:ABC-2 type transport system permease protein